MGKGLEKVVATSITKQAEANNETGFHGSQWGGRGGRSAEECVEATLEWARQREKEGLKVILVMTDVAQAFPTFAKIRLANRIRRMGSPEKVAAWTTSCMSERQVKLMFDGEEGEWQEVETGVPQDNPISPALFKIYIAPLLREIERVSQEKWEDRVITPTFIDDITYAIVGQSREEAEEIAETLLEMVDKRGRRVM